ncbi:MAG: hypothetical protein IPG46_08315 [Actinobacteria bacterium]|nr:hypothetical protein [Actinomycetota bacterium]
MSWRNCMSGMWFAWISLSDSSSSRSAAWLRRRPAKVRMIEDHRVDGIERDQQTVNDVEPVAGPARPVLGAAPYHVEAVLGVEVAQVLPPTVKLGTPLTSTTLFTPEGLFHRSETVQLGRHRLGVDATRARLDRDGISSPVRRSC